MIILDKPYVSPFLLQTIIANKLPVLRNAWLEQSNFAGDIEVWEPEAAVRRFSENGQGLIYSNSENALGWMVNNLSRSELPEKINLFKDKVLFRELLQPLYPDFGYREISLEELNRLDLDTLSFPVPFIIKPAIGFFSMGVNKVTGADDWRKTVKAINKEMSAVRTLYPLEVLDTTRFIIETWVKGEEFAIDAFYDGAGNVVLLNILHHLFSSAEDVSDRVYITSREIIVEHKTSLMNFLAEMGKIAGLRNFPVHAEVRIDHGGGIVPIEVNPMRFAGWCTTDVAHHAYGINPYTSFFKQAVPDWDRILSENDDHLYSIVVLDNPNDMDVARINYFDYDEVWSSFEFPLEMRRINYREYPVFGFLFSKTRKNNIVELERILRSDLKEFIH